MMKKLFTAVLFAAAIAVPFFASANTAPQTEQSAVQPEKQKAFGLMYVLPRNLTQVIYKMR